jgi:hypothetical protein
VIPTLGQKKFKMNLEHFTMPEYEEAFRFTGDILKGI